MRRDFGDGCNFNLGRRRARHFQRLGDMAALLGVEDWNTRESLEAYLRSPSTPRSSRPARRPRRSATAGPLWSFERMLQPVPDAGRAILEASAAARDAVEAYVRGEAFEAIIGALGIRHQVDRDHADPGVFLSLHG